MQSCELWEEVKTTALMTVCHESVTVCHESGTVCKESVTVWNESVTVCQESVTVCQESVKVCQESVIVCYESVTVCHKSVAVSRISDSVSWNMLLTEPLHITAINSASCIYFSTILKPHACFTNNSRASYSWMILGVSMALTWELYRVIMTL